MQNSPANAATAADDERRETHRRVTRWQMVIAIIGLVVVVGLVLRMFVLDGGHGASQNPPGDRQNQEDSGGHEPPPWVPEH